MRKLQLRKRGVLVAIFAVFLALTLIKINVVFASTEETLYVNAYDGAKNNWTKTGSSPYLENDTSNYISTSTSLINDGDYSFENTSLSPNYVVYLNIEAEYDGILADVQPFIYDGASWHGLAVFYVTASYTWKSYDISNILNTQAKINATKLYVRSVYVVAGTIKVRRARLDVSSGYPFTFHGVYNETTGLLTTQGCNVTAYFSDGTSPETFEVNGTYNYDPATHKPQYFHFELGENDREYWLEPTEIEATIYIFNGTLTTYTIAFLDLAGALDDYPFVEAQRYVNGTLRTVEKRRVDEEKKVTMSLINGVKYTITIQDGSSYVFGDLLMTSITTMQLTLKGIEFPKETLLTYKNVRLYATRAFGSDLAYALSFDGSNDYMNITDDSSLRFTGNFSVEAWAYIDVITDKGLIIAKGSSPSGTNYNYRIATHLSTSKWTYGVNSPTNEYWGDSDATIQTGVWTHLTLTASSGTITFYVNGAYDSEISGTPPWDGFSGNHTFLGELDGYKLNGDIDELRIYNRTITTSEITYSYNSGLGRYTPYNQTGLVAWYHFNEATGSTAYDETVNDNDGTISGASWVTSTIAIGPGTIVITYQDTLEQTISVNIYINYKNGTNIYDAIETADSFVHTWASALNSLDYRLEVIYNHQRYGEVPWKQYFPRTFSTAPFSLGWLGTLPFATSIIIPMFIILFVAGCFSQINAEVGAFLAVITAALLTYMGWINISAGYITTAFCLAVLMVLVYSKRRVQT